MERLTVKSKALDGIVSLVATDETCTDICANMDGDCDRRCPINEDYKRLAAYEDIGTPEQFAAWKKADEDGWLVELPCKVGDPIYILTTDSPTGIEHTFVNRICYKKNRVLINADCVHDDWGNAAWTLTPSQFGKTVFLTREAAQAALEAQEGKRNE